MTSLLTPQPHEVNSNYFLVQTDLSIGMGKKEDHKGHLDSKWVRLNVGGTQFLTTKQTLVEKSDYFRSLFSGKFMADCDESGVLSSFSKSMRIPPPSFLTLHPLLLDGDVSATRIPCTKNVNICAAPHLTHILINL